MHVRVITRLHKSFLPSRRLLCVHVRATTGQEGSMHVRATACCALSTCTFLPHTNLRFVIAVSLAPDTSGQHKPKVTRTFSCTHKSKICVTYGVPCAKHLTHVPLWSHRRCTQSVCCRASSMQEGARAKGKKGLHKSKICVCTPLHTFTPKVC